jgi:hypothetical protein
VAARLAFKSEVAVVTRLLAVALVLLTISHNVLADVVVTRSHKRFVGTLEHRADIARNTVGAKQVSLIISGNGADSLNVRRWNFPLWEIESVVFEDGDSKRVFDVVRRNRLNTFREQVATDDHFGTETAITGLVILLVGYLVPFGPPKMEWTKNATGSFEYKTVAENSYNGSNYVLMIAGSDLTVLGLAMQYADRPTVRAARAGDQKTLYLGASVHF